MLGKKITSFVVLEQNVLVPISHRLHNARGSGELDRGTRSKEQCPKAGCQHPKAEPVHPEARSNPIMATLRCPNCCWVLIIAN